MKHIEPYYPLIEELDLTGKKKTQIIRKWLMTLFEKAKTLLK